MRRGTVVAALLLTSAVTSGLTGCSSGVVPPPEKGINPNPSTEPPGPAPARPSAPPMTGRTVETGSMAFVVPAGSTGERQILGRGRPVEATTVELRSPASPCVVQASDLTNPMSFDFQDAVDLALDLNARRQVDREVRGERVYVVTGRARGVEYYEVGRDADDVLVSLTFRCRRPDATRTQQFVEAVLATVRWRK